MNDWLVRDALPGDENYIVPCWVKQLAKGPDAKEARGRGAPPSWSDDEFCVYFATMQPIVEALLRCGLTVRVVCLPDRPAAILAWAVTQGDTLYGVGIDRPYKSEFGGDLAKAVLGDALSRRMSVRLDVVDIGRPAQWVRESGWQASLRKASERWLLVQSLFGEKVTAAVAPKSRDAVHSSVMRHIYDAARVPWKPRERRAA